MKITIETKSKNHIHNWQCYCSQKLDVAKTPNEKGELHQIFITAVQHWRACPDCGVVQEMGR